MLILLDLYEKKKKKNSEWILSIRDKQIRLMLAINKFIFFFNWPQKISC